MYQSDWVEFDAPRHFFLHTRRSLEYLAAICGLCVDRTWDDSDAFVYWGSELYLRGLSLCDPAKKCGRSPLDYFSVEEIARFQRQAEEDNQLEVGGRTAFVLRHDSPGTVAAG
jgi:hypothetical protein